jgi:hypothetical protein
MIALKLVPRHLSHQTLAQMAKTLSFHKKPLKWLILSSKFVSGIYSKHKVDGYWTRVKICQQSKQLVLRRKIFAMIITV